MSDFDKDQLRRDYGALRQELELSACVFSSDGRAFKCGFHGEDHASGSVYDDGGAWKYKCHSCGIQGDIFDAEAKRRNMKPEDVIREKIAEHRRTARPRTLTRQTTTPTPAPEPVKVHATLEALKNAALFSATEEGATGIRKLHFYTNPDLVKPGMRDEDALASISDVIVIRMHTEKDGQVGKAVRQGMPVEGGFVLKAPSDPHPIYNRLRLRTAERVLVLEGEEKGEIATPYLPPGWAFTTSLGGAGKARHADWSPLAGKDCVLWPDYDPQRPKKNNTRAGHEHMKEVAAELQKLNPPARVSWLEPEELGLSDNNEDVKDFLQRFGADTDQQKRDVLSLALAQATPLDAATSMDRLLEEEIAGLHKSVAFPWPCTTRLGKALRRGAILLVAGDPGSGKSLWLMEAVTWMHLNKVSVAAKMLEDDRNYHLKRSLAQLAECAEVTDPDWIASHPNEARSHWNLHRAKIASLAPFIDDAPDEETTYDEILDWIEEKAKAGARVIAIDPITAAATSDRPWVDDLRFLLRAKSIIRRYGCSLILLTHPKGRKRMPGSTSLEDLAGGAAFPRFSPTVFWLVRFDQPKTVRCAEASPNEGERAGTFETDINRAVRIPKARNGPGSGVEIGFHFNPKSLRFEEIGVVIEDVSERELKEREARKPKGVEIPNWRNAMPGTPSAPQELNLEELGLP